MKTQHLKPWLAIVMVGVIMMPSLAQESPPAWAFPMNPPGFKLPADDGSVRRVPDSQAGYTLSQTHDRHAATDWHPEDHPPMPAVVANGRKPEVFACGWCHRADGPGGPENANLMGLPYAYIVAQLKDFRSGARGTSVAHRLPQSLMIAGVKSISDEEIDHAARYFSTRKPRHNLRVVEALQVPKSAVAGWHYVDLNSGETEPIGQRILEVPENREYFASRDSHARFIAYVPPGAISRGEELVRTGANGRSLPCANCHGPTMQGTDSIPPIAGRSPSYLGRQIHDFQSGARNGPGAAQMKDLVRQLTNDDIIDLAAYLATLPP